MKIISSLTIFSWSIVRSSFAMALKIINLCWMRQLFPKVTPVFNFHSKNRENDFFRTSNNFFRLSRYYRIRWSYQIFDTLNFERFYFKVVSPKLGSSMSSGQPSIIYLVKDGKIYLVHRCMRRILGTNRLGDNLKILVNFRRFTCPLRKGYTFPCIVSRAKQQKEDDDYPTIFALSSIKTILSIHLT